ncbi:MAG: NAD-dependent succinate-semialdehyde dehydrogenase [Candidatus Marinimicrobia bacterium]|nr:NAD-dependent succinate-semialdehyde dehydrogenase [Candidatus Neomarinimicrobiota bacterium]
MRAINPSSGRLIKEFTTHSPEEALGITECTHEAWLKWKHTDFRHRQHLMHQAAEVLRNNKETYARLMSTEMGKVIQGARAEVEKCAWVCDYYADQAESFLADEIVTTNASRSFVSFEPLGVVLAVMPWNFPFWQVFRFAAPALMAGNAGLLKHASNVPGCALAIQDVFLKAGFPENLFSTLMIPASQVKEIIAHKHVRAITLTGSELAGSQVAGIAGRELKKTVLELGGSDPYIVLDDANLDVCIGTSVNARMINTGQSCIAAKRFIVVEAVKQAFEERQKQIMSSMIVGDPLDEDTQVGPLAREDLLEELHKQVQSSLDMGARLVLGGKPVDRPGAFYQPTIVSDVKAGMSLYHEETFGPVSSIIPVKSTEEAIVVANDSDFGLGASLWTQDLKRGEKLARQIESGAVFINGMTASDPRLPFGGIKRSGYGRELSYFGIREFVNIKSIWIA